MSDRPDARRSRATSRILLVLPFVLLAVLVVAWSAFWFVAQREVLAGIAAFRAQEQAAGRVHACARETLGGFPFRFEWRCEDLVSRMEGAGGPATLRLPHLVVVAQAYRPDHVILDAEGPLDIAPAVGAPTTLDWATAQASLRVEDGRAERLSLVLDRATLDAPTARGDVATLRAAETELHLRAKPGAPAGAPAGAADYDLAATVRALAAAEGEATWDGALEAGLFALPPGAVDLPSFLRAWALGAGRVGISRLVLENGEAVVSGTGSLTLDEAGRPDGELHLAFAGLDRAGESVAGAAALIGMAAGFLGTPVQVEGRPGQQMTLAIENGAMRLGPVPIGALPPLY